MLKSKEVLIQVLLTAWTNVSHLVKNMQTFIGEKYLYIHKKHLKNLGRRMGKCKYFKPITDNNVEAMLQLGDEFGVKKLMDKCENSASKMESVLLEDVREFCELSNVTTTKVGRCMA
ncbi:hypothetical protein CHS0354_033138 [Potamilus streckersoni]|uniref:Uncharacterized protein n=1 Tax=Potamilus streckersoni TaxID=2493646 RepID=A0AAE0S6B8_9BIVA|nr:hypothetical protein CHS0354_033138 [Potamilus streckersoni]